MIRAFVFAGSVLAGISLGAQSPSHPLSTSFEVASIKLNKSSDSQYGIRSDAGLLRATNVTLATLIRWAYGDRQEMLPPNRLIVSAPWMGDPGDPFLKGDRFDVIARADGNPSDEQLALMLRALLADRFKLAVREELRELAVYHLLRSRKPGTPVRLHPTSECGPDFDPAAAKPSTLDVEPCSFRFSTGRIVARGVAIAALTTMLTAAVDDHRAVEDRTGLTERFDLELEWRPDIGGADAPLAADTAGPSLFTALEEQLGLTLEPHKDRITVLVVDHAEPPAPD